MLRTINTLDHAASDKDFFDRIQFPVEYTFPQDQATGAVDRTFKQSAFTESVNLRDKAFALVNSDTGKALSLNGDGCTSSTRIVQQMYNKTNLGQQFKLNDEDQLESVECDGKVIELPGECKSGAGLVLSDSNRCPYQECIDRCTDQYGGDGSSGDSYYCAKGCAGMSSGQIVNPSYWCGVDEAERYDTCVVRCEYASSNEAHKGRCRYGCEFWIVETMAPTSHAPSKGPTKAPVVTSPPSFAVCQLFW